MHLEISVGLLVVSLSSTLFCLTIGAPAGGSEKGERSDSGRAARVPYSPQEDAFIIAEVIAKAETYEGTPWRIIATDHERKVIEGELGFPKKRSGDSLRKHFEHLKQTIPDWTNRKTAHGTAYGYTHQEEDFINQELLKNAYRSASMYSDDIWQAILDQHNLKREQKCNGFSNARTLIGLRSHFMVSMRIGGRVSEDVKKHFQNNFRKQKGDTEKNKQIHPGHGTSAPRQDSPMAQGNAEDDKEVYDIIMKDLASLQNSQTVDERGIDHRLFVD